MPSLLDIKARIKLVGNIRKVTRAMQLVAAAKFTRSQDRARTARPYAAELDEILGILSGVVTQREEALGIEPGAHEEGTPVSLRFVEDSPPIETTLPRLFAAEESTKPGVVLVTSDRGLCGAFNAKLIRAAQEFVSSNSDKECKLILLGKKGYQYFRKRSIPIIYHREGISDRLNLGEIKEIAAELTRLFVQEEVDSIQLIYARFRSALASDIVTERFLSIPSVEHEGALDTFILEPDTDRLLERLLPLYATTKVFSALADSFASEYGSRMTAMQLATNNAEEMLQDLVILRNRMRQAMITKELGEIVGGAEALK